MAIEDIVALVITCSIGAVVAVISAVLLSGRGAAVGHDGFSSNCIYYMRRYHVCARLQRLRPAITISAGRWITTVPTARR